MASPCKKCPFLSDDGDACCFAVMMDIPFAAAIDFEGDPPDECVELCYFKSILEDLEEEECVQKGMLDDYRRFVQALEENWEAIKSG